MGSGLVQITYNKSNSIMSCGTIDRALIKQFYAQFFL